jgi:uncharacterized membrane protein
MDEFYGMHGPHGPHWFWGPGLFGMVAPLLLTLLWLAPLILLIWYARRAAMSHAIGKTPAPPVETPAAVEALRQRYVRGEIDFGAFERMLSDLDAGDRTQPLADEASAADEEQAAPQFRPRPDEPVDWS